VGVVTVLPDGAIFRQSGVFEHSFGVQLFDLAIGSLNGDTSKIYGEK